MSGFTLVSTGELSKQLAAWRVFDCRHDLARPDLGEQQYRESHLPGALFAHLERDLSAPKTGRNGRHPLPDPGAFAVWLGKQGLEPQDQVVCYDAGNGAMAARLWWMLRWMGQPSVAVLDGGLAKWLKEGLPVTAAVPQFAPTQYRGKPRPEAAVTVDSIQKSSYLLIDARAPARFRGEQEPIDPVAGRIPGAVNRFNMDNVRSDGTFKSAAELKQDFQEVLKGRAASEAINYCGSGVSACHNLLAMEVAGLFGAKLYPGSWSEWIADPSRPRERG